MFSIIDCFSGFGYLISDLGVNIGSFVQAQSGWLMVVVLVIGIQWE